ncbi:hypothetical protein BC940DRAFT_94062 [Gongronella butleri]|nr:hypothetical protein BC940DRAFT_94062 [Gongronella butleri]
MSPNGRTFSKRWMIVLKRPPVPAPTSMSRRIAKRANCLRVNASIFCSTKTHHSWRLAPWWALVKRSTPWVVPWWAAWVWSGKAARKKAKKKQHLTFFLQWCAHDGVCQCAYDWRWCHELCQYAKDSPFHGNRHDQPYPHCDACPLCKHQVTLSTAFCTENMYFLI